MAKHKQTWVRIMKYIGVYKALLFFSFLLAFGTVITTLTMPVIIGKGVDAIVGKGEVQFKVLFSVFKQMILLLISTAFMQWLQNIVNYALTYRVVMDIRTKAFSKLHQLPFSYLDKQSHGDILSRIMNDIDQFSDGIFMGTTQLFTGVITIIGTVSFMLYTSKVMALVVIFLTPLSMVVASFIARKTFTMFRDQSVARGMMTEHIQEMIANQKIVKAFSYETRSEETFLELNNKLEKVSLKATFYSSLTNPATRFINNIVYVGVATIGAYFTMGGMLSVGQLTCFLNYANQYTKPFNEISGVITELQNALASAKRVFEFLDETPLPSDEKNMKLKEFKKEIKMTKVDFSYDKETPFMTDLNLTIKKGEKIAVVGATGCGKSTLIQLIMGFYTVDRGKITIDKLDIDHIKRESFRKKIGLVLQDTWLKSGTIKENIAYGTNASMEEIIEAAKMSYAHTFIKRMEKGYDTMLKEDGNNLSSGQKQLLSIARVMLLKPPILILDEATSSIDTRTEFLIQKALERLMEGKTSFIVAHRLSTIREADKIIVMDKGKIVEIGNHTELLQNKGLYYQLYQMRNENTVDGNL